MNVNYLYTLPTAASFSRMAVFKAVTIDANEGNTQKKVTCEVPDRLRVKWG